MEDTKSDRQSTNSPKVMSSCQSSVASSISYQDAEFEVTRFIDRDYDKQDSADSSMEGSTCSAADTTPISKFITVSGQKIVSA